MNTYEAYLTQRLSELRNLARLRGLDWTLKGQIEALEKELADLHAATPKAQTGVIDRVAMKLMAAGYDGLPLETLRTIAEIAVTGARRILTPR